MIDSEFIKNFNVSDSGSIAKLDFMLRSLDDFRAISISEICSIFPDQVSLLVVGLWSFDFLKPPVYVDGKLKSYNGFLEKDDILKVSCGLLEIIRHCRIDLQEDIHAIDYHYSACVKLYRLLGGDAEELVLSALQKELSIPLIDALGILVGHELKGFLSDKSIAFLKKISEEHADDFGVFARKVLIDDVGRVMKL